MRIRPTLLALTCVISLASGTSAFAQGAGGIADPVAQPHDAPRTLGTFDETNQAARQASQAASPAVAPEQQAAPSSPVPYKAGAFPSPQDDPQLPNTVDAEYSYRGDVPDALPPAKTPPVPTGGGIAGILTTLVVLIGVAALGFLGLQALQSRAQSPPAHH